jgi:hypothetical protein
MSANLESSNGELCVRDQSKPPLGRSIMSFKIICASSTVLAIARYIESSTKPSEASLLFWVESISGAL